MLKNDLIPDLCFLKGVYRDLYPNGRRGSLMMMMKLMMMMVMMMMNMMKKAMYLDVSVPSAGTSTLLE